MQISDLRELISALNDSNIQQFEMENSEVKLKISKNNIVVPANTEINVVENYSNKENIPVLNEKSNPLKEDDSIITVMSPMVGVYYEAPSADSEPFVKIGDIVTEGESLCIIEAMKIMNEISAEFKGEIVDILIRNEDVVEYGQPLLKIRRL